MPLPQTMTDPLAAWVAGAADATTRRPIPLIATDFEVAIEGGLARVSTKRLFRNDEADGIEATLTFPVPVHATLFALEARIAGRRLVARARARAAAREDYEDALQRGKAAVLHEEVLRGIHMLSVGPIPPGAEVEVTASWAMTLTRIGDEGRLRIPLTVGDVYGRSGLPDSDELIHGGPSATATLAVHCTDGSVTLAGGRLLGGRATVPLDAPIDLAVTGWTSRPLRGRAADGREVVLRVAPCPAADAAVDVALLVDRSGSMDQACTGHDRRPTKHQAVVAGLQTLAGRLRVADRIDLWQFDNQPHRVGVAGSAGVRAALRDLAGRLGRPRGGTEIGRALAAVIDQSPARDLLLVTDGKSHALDVQGLARSGRRFSIVLVGEDSLEANVGHLAALTGGEIFVAAGGDLSDHLAAAFAALRASHGVAPPLDGRPRQIATRRGGMTLAAEWRTADEPIADGIDARAVAAFCAGLALPALDAAAATALAEAEGLVTHLTSLVLVDEAGATQEGIPATRKIALATPRTAFAAAPNQFAARMLPPRPEAPGSAHSAFELPDSGSLDLSDHLEGFASPSPVPRLSGLAERIDWDAAPQRLQAGDLSPLEPTVAAEIRRSAADPAVRDLARKLRLDPVALVIALIARAHGLASRSAARIARALLGSRITAGVRAIARRLGLDVGPDVPPGDGTP